MKKKHPERCARGVLLTGLVKKEKQLNTKDTKVTKAFVFSFEYLVSFVFKSLSTGYYCAKPRGMFVESGAQPKRSMSASRSGY